MIWVLAAIVVVTIGVMAVIDAYFEGDRDLLNSYGKEMILLSFMKTQEERTVSYDDSCNA